MRTKIEKESLFPGIPFDLDAIWGYKWRWLGQDYRYSHDGGVGRGK